MYKLKQNIDLTQNKVYNDNVKIENGNLIIVNQSDTIRYNASGYYINNVYQGQGAEMSFDTDFGVSELFEEVEDGDRHDNTN